MKQISNEELWKLKDKEKPEDLPKYLMANYADRFSFVVLKHRDFWFSLGYGSDGKLNLSGNCYEWSNAFQFEKPSFKFLFEVLNYHNKIEKDVLKRIIAELKGSQNMLFFCKEDYRTRKADDGLTHKQLSWHFYPTENYRVSTQIPFTGLIQDLVKLNKFAEEVRQAEEKAAKEEEARKELERELLSYQTVEQKKKAAKLRKVAGGKKK